MQLQWRSTSFVKRSRWVRSPSPAQDRMPSGLHLLNERLGISCRSVSRPQRVSVKDADGKGDAVTDAHSLTARLSRSSSGPGHQPLTLGTGVQFPYGTPRSKCLRDYIDQGQARPGALRGQIPPEPHGSDRHLEGLLFWPSLDLLLLRSWPHRLTAQDCGFSHRQSWVQLPVGSPDRMPHRTTSGK